MLAHGKRRLSHWPIASFSCFFEHLQYKSWGWFLYELLRKIIVNYLFMLGKDSGSSPDWEQYLLVFFVFAALVHSWAQPYMTVAENWLELFSILFLVVVLHLQPDGSQDGWTWFVFLLVVSFVIVFVFVMKSVGKINDAKLEGEKVVKNEDVDDKI